MASKAYEGQNKFNPYDTRDSLTMMPKFAQARIAWDVHNPFAEGNTQGFRQLSTGGESSGRMLSGTLTGPGGSMGQAPGANLDKRYDRKLESPSVVIGRMEDGIQTMRNAGGAIGGALEVAGRARAERKSQATPPPKPPFRGGWSMNKPGQPSGPPSQGPPTLTGSTVASRAARGQALIAERRAAALAGMQSQLANAQPVTPLGPLTPTSMPPKPTPPTPAPPRKVGWGNTVSGATTSPAVTPVGTPFADRMAAAVAARQPPQAPPGTGIPYNQRASGPARSLPAVEAAKEAAKAREAAAAAKKAEEAKPKEPKAKTTRKPASGKVVDKPKDPS